MKKTILITIALFITGTIAFAQSTESSFGVRGNCGMCKKTIEKAAKSIDGVTSAIWDREAKTIQVTFDTSIIKLLEIHKAIAKSGYDTEQVTANKLAYDNLPGCCQYDRTMKIDQL